MEHVETRDDNVERILERSSYSNIVKQPMECRKQCELDTARRADLVEDVRDVALDCVLADTQLRGNGTIRLAGDYPAHDVELARRQSESLDVLTRPRETPDDRGGIAARSLGANPVLT